MSTHPLPITIVGGGISGLVAAIYLRKHGHEVTIFEQSRLAQEIGAAFHITPNASAVLAQIGIDPHDSGAVDAEGILFLDQKDGHTVLDVPRSPLLQRLPPEECWVLAHRFYFHKQLKERAIQDGVKLLTGMYVTKVEGLRIHFQDGTTYDAEVIVGADGVHSKVRSSLHPTAQPFATPWAAFRFLINREDVEKHSFHDKILPPGKTCYWGKPEVVVVAYPTMRNTQFNFVCIFPTRILGIEPKYDTQYSQKASMEQLKHVYRDFEPQIQTLIQMADPDNLRYWPLMDMADLPSYIGDGVCLLGDAAHPFLPFAYQGAGLAIEDGGSFAEIIAGVQTKDEFNSRLPMYEELRHERCADIQQFSRDTYRDHTNDKDWDPPKRFEEIYLYRVLDEVKKLKEQGPTLGITGKSESQVVVEVTEIRN